MRNAICSTFAPPSEWGVSRHTHPAVVQAIFALSSDERGQKPYGRCRPPTNGGKRPISSPNISTMATSLGTATDMRGIPSCRSGCGRRVAKINGAFYLAASSGNRDKRAGESGRIYRKDCEHDIRIHRPC